jgi:hypothetical protein
MLLPLLVTLVVGGTVTLLLGVGTLLPVWRLMLQLGT